MKKAKNYIIDSINEVRHRVSWPSFDKTQRNAMLVLVASLIFAVVIGVMDLGFKNALEIFYEGF